MSVNSQAATGDPIYRNCPSCGALATEAELARQQYRCERCGLEIAHVETTPTGMTRNLRWLLGTGDMVLDRYRIEKILGKGGFAATYLVEDMRIQGKRRALKEIPEFLYDHTETELLGRLNHPAILDITDRDHADGMVYLVLEFGGGRTLDTERKEEGGRISLERLTPWIAQLGDVLSYLHERTPPVVHRDLKPENILLDERDRIMLIDFGIAKQSADSGETRMVARAATNGFSPPEQAMGTGTDPRSDVYSFAATLYALLTGQAPPPSHQRVAGEEIVPPHEIVEGLPERISTALMSALSLNINTRPASIRDLFLAMGLTPGGTDPASAGNRTVMVESLADAYTSQGSIRISTEYLEAAPPVVPVPPTQKRRLPLVVGLSLILLALAAGGAWFWLGRDNVSEPSVASGESKVTPSPDPMAQSPPHQEVPAKPAAPMVSTTQPAVSPSPQKLPVKPPTPIVSTTQPPTPAPAPFQLPATPESTEEKGPSALAIIEGGIAEQQKLKPKSKPKPKQKKKVVASTLKPKPQPQSKPASQSASGNSDWTIIRRSEVKLD